MDNFKQNDELREDIRLLGELLGNTIKTYSGDELFHNIENIRLAAIDVVVNKSSSTKEIEDLIKSLSDSQLTAVTKSYSQFLNFANIAEQYHRVRRTRWYENNTDSIQPGSIKHLFEEFKEKNISKDLVYRTVSELDIDLVLTAHPTEVKRQTMIAKYEKIADYIKYLDTEHLTKTQINSIHENIGKEIALIWLSDEIRISKPTPVDEAAWGASIIESSIWHAIPKFFKELNRELYSFTGKELSLKSNVFKFSSWMGGDRDGNDKVTSKITADVCANNRNLALKLIKKDLESLKDELSITIANSELQKLTNNAAEPYRQILADLILELENKSESEIIDVLIICYNSLIDINAKQIADTKLLGLIQKINCFGTKLLTTDIRQEATRHTKLMAEITQALGLGNFETMNSTEKINFLIAELNNTRPLVPLDIKLSPESKEVWDTFLVLNEIPRKALGSYVISMASNESDVLLVLVLQQAAGISQLLPVVPLFETLDDLNNSEEIMDNLLSIPEYRQEINNYQQIMIGYSDSAKDAGFIAASWGQYQAQEKLQAIANKYEVDVVFFHGRGGSVGRGGWPTHDAIISQPPGTINGKIRVTQQGEVIQYKFGWQDIAIRTLSVYFTATTKATLIQPESPKDAWRALLNDISRKSSTHYRANLEGEEFIDIFKKLTPLNYFQELCIGSRATSRTKKLNDLSAMRAIPWVFAWTQCRLILPSWLGVGEALKYIEDTKRLDLTCQMYTSWPFFRCMLSMIEMVLAKVDLEIFEIYERRLEKSKQLEFTKKYKSEYLESVRVLKKILGNEELLANNMLLKSSIAARSIYLLPLHLLQVEAMNRENSLAVLLSITGIAAGMRNTG